MGCGCGGMAGGSIGDGFGWRGASRRQLGAMLLNKRHQLMVFHGATAI